ncbi:MAG: hypothetical protein DSZ08_04220 [Sulfurovum sp.]|nr:MAG: hypothetical protein DSZ08_04220 [Sulfurovum sp.]
MGTVMIAIGVGLFYSLGIFFICEEKSLKNSDLSDIKLIVEEEVDISKFFAEYQTVKYLSYFFIAIFLFAVILANYVYIPHHFGLSEILSYTFITSLLGSLTILLVKWRFQPIIKLISSFMYGSVFMMATALAFALVYAIKG